MVLCARERTLPQLGCARHVAPQVHLFPLSAMFGLCAAFLAVAAVCQARLEKLAHVSSTPSEAEPLKRCAPARAPDRAMHHVRWVLRASHHAAWRRAVVTEGASSAGACVRTALCRTDDGEDDRAAAELGTAQAGGAGPDK